MRVETGAPLRSLLLHPLSTTMRKGTTLVLLAVLLFAGSGMSYAQSTHYRYRVPATRCSGRNFEIDHVILGARLARKKPHPAVPHNPQIATRTWIASSGMAFRVHSDGMHMYIEWANPPVPGIWGGGQLLRKGTMWQGTLTYFVTCDRKPCFVDAQLEISRVSDSEIEGRALVPSKFDCRTCQVTRREWHPLSWLPK